MIDSHPYSEPAVAAPALAAMRHSCAHLLAAAIRELWPAARFGVGPAIEDGFYYDVEFPEPVGDADLPRIEQRMREIQARDEPFVAGAWPVDRAIATMRAADQPYKAELVALLRERGSTAVGRELDDDLGGADDDAALSEVGVVSLGGFTDLCKGPHVASAGAIGPFRLTGLAGAYWRGDASRPQLTRVYGLCFASQEALDHRLWEIAEARKRDHRLLGRQLDIYAMSDAVGAGLPLWLPNGTAIRLELEKLARAFEGRAGYRPVSTPAIAREGLYLKSGHLPYYAEDMYAAIEIDAQRYRLRPMCCPHHHEVYLARPHSYRDLPLRIAEYGQVLRHEASGALSGLLRTRGFCQNDAHVYCREDQAHAEFVDVMRLHARYYELFGIKDYHMRLSLPDLEGSDKYVDDPPAWARAIAIIRAAMAESGLPFVEVPGEAAFYGPKIDFMIRSAVGQSYAISTNQLDFVASRRFGLTYTGEDGAPHPVYVIHRAPLGSHERFVAFLLEHYAGALPTWLSPLHALVIPVSSRHEAYARRVREQLLALEAPTFDGCLRVEVDASNERMQKKIAQAQAMKTPYMLVVGDQEAAAGTVAIRRRDGVAAGAMRVEEFALALCGEIGVRSTGLGIGGER
jgi:threonyl-tRNA synthetase